MTNTNEQPTCQGCALNPNWFTNPTYQHLIPLMLYKDNSLTQDELIVLGHLREAWNAFVALDAKHPDHNNEFRDSIHKCQYIIGTRVAQRVNPEIWYVPTEREREDI